MTNHNPLQYGLFTPTSLENQTTPLTHPRKRGGEARSFFMFPGVRQE
ncbi:MAG: hypothetical protein ACFKPT_14050 [Gloeotrichia echinulata GP01]